MDDTEDIPPEMIKAEQVSNELNRLVDVEAFAKFSPEAKQIADKVDVLDNQMMEATKVTFLPSANKVKNTFIRHFAIMGGGAVIAGGVAAYLSSGLTLLPQALITSVGAIAGGITTLSIDRNQFADDLEKHADGMNVADEKISILTKERTVEAEKFLAMAKKVQRENPEAAKAFMKSTDHVNKQTTTAHVDALQAQENQPDFAHTR